MKHYTFGIIILMFIVSCRAKENPVSHRYSEISSITNKSEQAYLTQSLTDFSKVSDIAKNYLKTLSVLELKASELKIYFEKEQVIPARRQEDLMSSFGKSLDYISTSDSNYLEMLKSAPIRTSEDIDLIMLFIKRCYVKSIETNRYLFNCLGTMAAAESLNIEKGQNLSATLSLIAANTNKPAEWFILKDGGSPLTKENISDTLYPDKFGKVILKKRQYTLGDNRLFYATKVQSTRGEVILFDAIDFKVH